VLQAAHALEPAFAAALQYTIIEPLPAQRVSQRITLAQHARQVCWLLDFKELEPFVGVHFSNELIDAFPVHLIGKSQEGAEWHECAVGWEEERFVWKEAPLSNPALASAAARLPRNLPAPYRTEVNLAAGQWICEVAAKLQRGWVLAVDYGYPHAEYYRPERNEGTLSGYANHQRVEDVLHKPGEADLTAHVDFSTLASDAESAGLQLCGFADQHHFMVGLSGLHFRRHREHHARTAKGDARLQNADAPESHGRGIQGDLLCGREGNKSRHSRGFRFAGSGQSEL
jgi:SAM-dependent MidA family methyltransferase